LPAPVGVSTEANRQRIDARLSRGSIRVARVRTKNLFVWALATFVLLQVALVWIVPVVPGHDLPQHLAYARLLASYPEDPGLRDAYVVAERFDPYCATHYLLAYLARGLGVNVACRVLYSAYAISLTLACVLACRAVWPKRTPWPSLFGTLLVWNPITWMGFLPFTMALPFVLAAIAAYVMAIRKRAWRWTVFACVASAAAATVHVVAGGMALVFILGFALASRRRRDLQVTALVASLTVLVVALTRRGSPSIVWSELASAIRTHGPSAGITGFFRASFTTPGQKLGLLLATIFGPFKAPFQIAVALGLGLVMAVAVSRGRWSTNDHVQRSYGRAAFLFLVACWLVPTSIQVPDDICLVDLRMFAIAALFGCAAIPPRPFMAKWTRGTLVLTVMVASLVGGRQLLRVGEESMPPVRLVSHLAPKDRVLALAMHNRSEHLTPSNALTHYLPLYHTINGGGRTSSFWGSLLPHLPVGERHAMAKPPDWSPWRVTPTQIADATHVLLERADREDPEDAYQGTRRVLADTTLTVLACDGRWCLLATHAQD